MFFNPEVYPFPMKDEDKIKLDPHVHSEDSFDGKEPVELILEQAEDIGLDAVAITDHDEIQESLRAAEIDDEYDVTAVPGVEVSTNAGHLLALGVKEKPESGMSLKKTIKRIRELGGAAVLPHPFQRSRHGVKKRKVKKKFPDAMEIYNSWLFTGYRNRSAKKFARKRDIPGVAASDSHSITTIGRAYTEIDIDKEEVDQDDIVEAITEGDVEVRGKRVPVYKSFFHYVKGAGRKAVYAIRKILRR